MGDLLSNVHFEIDVFTMAHSAMSVHQSVEPLLMGRDLDTPPGKRINGFVITVSLGGFFCSSGPDGQRLFFTISRKPAHFEPKKVPPVSVYRRRLSKIGKGNERRI
jgi:hypothetical protein